jgi:hypothetical protein
MQHPTYQGYALPDTSGNTQPIPMQPPRPVSPAPPGAFPPPSAAPAEERPLGELIGQLSRDGSLLIKQEIALAKLELSEKAARLKTQATFMAAGAVALYTGALALVAGLILLLAEVTPAWVAALLVGTAIATVGAVLLLRGKNNLEKMDLTPDKTVSNLRQDVHAVAEATRG